MAMPVGRAALGVCFLTLLYIIAAGLNDRQSPSPVERVRTNPLPKAYSPAAQPYKPASRVEDLEARLEPYVTAAVQAQFVYMCGFRDAGWAGRISTDARLLFGSTIEGLTRAEREELVSWQNGVVDRMSAAVPISRINNDYCRQLADAGIIETVERRASEMAGGRLSTLANKVPGER